MSASGRLPGVLSPGWRVVRRGWRTLTSMRTALILLFLLAVAAVPGSILPQRPLNPDKTTSYIASHGAWGRLLDHLGMFDVFGSAWFAAIYLLLVRVADRLPDPAHPAACPRIRA